MGDTLGRGMREGVAQFGLTLLAILEAPPPLPVLVPPDAFTAVAVGGVTDVPVGILDLDGVLYAATTFSALLRALRRLAGVPPRERLALPLPPLRDALFIALALALTLA